MNEPDIFFYLNGDDKIDGLLGTLCLRARTMVFHSIEDLARRLRHPRENAIIAVLLAGTEDELLELLSIRSLFLDIPVILILPDRKMETISKGRKLYPRFLTYADGDLSEIAAVLGKMLEKFEKEKIWRNGKPWIRGDEKIRWMLFNKRS